MRNYFMGFMILMVSFAANAGVKEKPVIVLDAGHGASKIGSFSYSGFSEHNQTARMRAKIVTALKDKGFAVRLTNQEGNLMARAGVPGQLLLSIHYDSVPSVLRKSGVGNTVFGYSAFVSKQNPFYQKSLACARSISWGLQHAGEKAALFHQKGLGGKAPRPLVDAKLGVHRFDDLIVLKKSKQAAVLLEVGMWINKHDEKRLMSDDVMTKQATGIALGIEQCLRAA